MLFKKLAAKNSAQVIKGGGSRIQSAAKRLKRARQFQTADDPARGVFGPGHQSHPQEIARMRAVLEDAGVKVRDAPGTRGIAYGPSGRAGRPGTLTIDPNASYSAWRHEFKHFLDDQESGWQGIRALTDKKLRWEWEVRAYAEELKIARRANEYLGRVNPELTRAEIRAQVDGLVRDLEKLKNKEWINIHKPHLNR